MNSRRQFLKNAAILSGAAGLPNVIPMSIQKAMAISADPGSTFLDAEHIVFLMQENRSFDHMFGKLKGVRGFNDPRAYTLPDKDKVWLQKDEKGNTYAPFHVDINKTKITWQGGLPHSWNDQVAARNGGRYDKWIPVKSLMSLGYYDRTDIPFYYAMTDAFTICDHHFCSSLTGTTPNRLFFWSGTIRPEQNGEAIAAVNNSQAESRNDVYVDWHTFPELLETHNISWKIYQNELWTANLKGREVDSWLGNYGDNAMEYVKRYNVKLSAYFRKHGDDTVNPPLSAEQVRAKYEKLSSSEKNLIDKAFATNINSPKDYLALNTFSFTDDKGASQRMNIPENDLFYQFRSDVDNGNLPAVSWLVAPQKFSDHTSSPLYGTWYVSEAMDILTKNPEVWKKTIFILTYDENDGYFDHMPPYVVPKPNTPDTGKVSAQIDVAVDYELKKDSPIGLGYRVPMLIASPWSKGGYVNSQVFDHTSCLMFLEHFLSKKTGKVINSENISSWRRAVCGDLTSAFRPAAAEPPVIPPRLKKKEVLIQINNARNKPAQLSPNPLKRDEIEKINSYPSFSVLSPDVMAKQETGTRPACALPYQLSSSCNLDVKRENIELHFESGKAVSRQKTRPSGVPFCVYTSDIYKGKAGKIWNYTLTAGDQLTDTIKLEHFADEQYDLKVTAPNGFFRRFKGTRRDPLINIICLYERKGLLSKKLTGNIELLIENSSNEELKLEITDEIYKTIEPTIMILAAQQRFKLILDLKNSGSWYDFRVKLSDNTSFLQHYAGHVETGEDSITDPFMAGLL